MIQPSRVEKYSPYMRSFVLSLIAAFILSAVPLLSQEINIKKIHYVIGVARNLPPYSFLDENGKVIGYSVDITQAIAQVMQLDIEVRIAPFGELRQDLKNGKIDAMPMYYSDYRKKIVDFTSSYSTIHNAIFIRKDSPAIETEEELQGKKIIVISGDIMHDYVIENDLTNKLVTVSMETEALELLASGKHDCALMAQLPGLYYVKKLGIASIKTTGPLMVPSKICYALKKGNTKLNNLLSEGLATIGENGEHTRIHDKWLGVLIPRGIPISTALKYIAFVVVPLLLFLAFFAIWSRMLKMQVTLRTRELSESEHRLSTHLQNTPIGALSWDLNFKAIDWNPAAEAIFGYSKTEAMGKHVTELILPDEMKEMVDDIYRDLISGKGGTRSTNENLTKDGRRIICDWYNTILKDADGNVIGAASLVNDITERQQAEEELKKHRDHLEELVKERTVELEAKNTDLERMNDLFVGREFRIKELKNRIKELELTIDTH